MPAASLRPAELQRVLDTARRRAGVPGAAAGIVLGGREAVAVSGVTSVDDPLPVDAQTLFMVGSTTKTFTATALMRLVEQGKLSLDDRVVAHLPRFRLADRAAARAVTVRHLVTHTGGWDGDIFLETGWGDDALERYVAALREQPQEFPPGAVWAYNNAGFCVAGRVIETVTGMPYERAVGELLLRPLGMEHSFFFPDEVLTRRHVVGHVHDGRRARVRHTWGLSRALAPAGGLVSTVRDQLTWARFHLGDGRSAAGRRILRQSTMRSMQRDMVAAGAIADTCGVSWLISNGTVRRVAHGGNVSGLQISGFTMVPERSFAVTVLTNSGNGRRVADEVERWAFERVLGVSEPPPVYVEVDRNLLAECTGSFTSKLSRIQVTLEGGRLRLGSRWQADVDSIEDEEERALMRRLVAAPPRTVELAFTAADRVVVRRGPDQGVRGEFLRIRAGGGVDALRWGGRVHLRDR